MKCPVGRDQSKPCPMKYLNGFPERSLSSCFACLMDFQERASIIEFDGGRPRAESEKEAAEQIRNWIARVENPQMEIKT